MRDILHERARLLAAGGDTLEDGSPQLEVLRFDLASEKYALELRWIAEVRPIVGFAPLPGAPPLIRGIVNVRGRIVSLVDVKVLFELPDAGISSTSRVIILNGHDMEFGLLADEVVGIEMISMEAAQSSLASLTGVRSEFLKGITADGTVLMDGEKMLASERMVVKDTRPRS